MNLVKKAKQKKPRNLPIKDDHIELAILWLQDNISLGQIQHALGKKFNVASRLPYWIKAGYKKGKIKI